MKKYILLIWILVSPLVVQGKTLYLAMLDIDNISSFNKYFKTLKIKRGDRFIILDTQNSQFIFEKKITSPNEEILYNKPYQFIKVFSQHYKAYKKVKHRELVAKQKLYALSKERNDLARALKSVHHFLLVYKEKYKNIKVMFFGESYLHRAYGHDFDQGIPSDGFIYADESEFNSFEDMNVSSVKFAIFYDTKPYALRNKMFRFYDKLFQKKFGSRLESFNLDAVFDADTHTKYNAKPFFAHKVEVIPEGIRDSCLELDKVTKNDLPGGATFEVMIVNECRKNTIISFSHNGEKSQETVDKDGSVTTRFKKVAGQNTIRYIGLDGRWKTLLDEQVPNRQDGVEIELDSATSTVIVRGKNPLRKEGEVFEIVYKNTGGTFYPKIKNGAFEKVIPITTGENTFTWKDMNNKVHSETISFYPKCTDRVSFDEGFAKEYGILKVTLKNGCREENSVVKFIYNDKNYFALIQKGKAERNIILHYDVNDVFYENFDRNTQKLATIEIDDFESLIRFMVSYKDNVIVSMNVYEPHRGLDTTKPVDAVDYNDSSKYMDGHLHLSNLRSQRGAIWVAEYPPSRNYLNPKLIQEYTQIYVTRKEKQQTGKLSFYVDYFSRHGRYNGKAPLCGKRSLGGIVVTYDVLWNGASQVGRKFLNPSECKNGYPKREDSQLILIKKVEIE